ncbi:helix-turn-helix transcriptional regulator [Robertkochia solimangrovi]|uniref:helix-turn-helix transcriptional regulator n=1 Tax=Robertkochia solimangrovi TaxID=2213046 RepID=UPI0011805936|nr:helix-turn-helix transcriptional regulator [Robertkochia solimangrovi]TRZ45312.1 transcriptional regulator [Robertkochia solimangrovi]
MINSVDFSKRLEQVLDYYELTASAFADTIGVQRSSISHILSGRNKPSLDFVMKILQHFPDVELYWLLNGKGNFPLKRNSTAAVTTPNLKLEFEEPETKPQEKTVTALTQEIVTSQKEKEIARIVIFYTNGTFEEFKKPS